MKCETSWTSESSQAPSNLGALPFAGTANSFTKKWVVPAGYFHCSHEKIHRGKLSQSERKFISCYEK